MVAGAAQFGDNAQYEFRLDTCQVGRLQFVRDQDRRLFHHQPGVVLRRTRKHTQDTLPDVDDVVGAARHVRVGQDLVACGHGLDGALPGGFGVDAAQLDFLQRSLQEFGITHHEQVGIKDAGLAGADTLQHAGAYTLQVLGHGGDCLFQPLPLVLPGRRQPLPAPAAAWSGR